MIFDYIPLGIGDGVRLILRWLLGARWPFNAKSSYFVMINVNRT